MNTNHRKRPAMAKCSHKGNTKEDKAMTEHNLEQNKGKGKALMESTCEQGKGKGQANGNKCIKACLKIKVNVHTGKAKVDEGVTKPMEDMDVDVMDMLENTGLTSVSKGNLPITFKHIYKLKTEMDMYEFQEGNDMSMVIINGNKKVYHGGWASSCHEGRLPEHGPPHDVSDVGCHHWLLTVLCGGWPCQ
jgi:hypothetical protein